MSDLHIGGEAELARQGIYLPAVATAKLKVGWSGLVEVLRGSGEKSRLILAGMFLILPRRIGEAIAFFCELVEQLPSGCSITLLMGNHDPERAVFERITGDFEVTFASAAEVGGYAVFHGHQSADAEGIGGGRWQTVRDEEGKTCRRWIPLGMIVGHQHPAVTLATRVQSAKMICFVSATVSVGDARIPLLILPAFSPLPLGSDISVERHWILDLPRPVDGDIRIAGIVESTEARPAVILDFGPLSELP